MKALEKLSLANRLGKFVCVGLDSDMKKIPPHLLNSKNPVFEFNREIIQATSEYAAAYKLNFAFYEKFGARGFEIIKDTLNLIPKSILTIGDAKRGDIGNTSAMYAESIFETLNFDSMTVNPYMGEDSVKPFLSFDDKLVFILTLTSNPGAQDFEKLELSDGTKLFQRIIQRIKLWNNGNCGIVFGATNIKELEDNIDLIAELPVLLPGIGAQGGSLEDVVRVFKKQGRLNFIVNVSRGLIYKSSLENFAVKANNELLALNKTIQKVLNF